MSEGLRAVFDTNIWISAELHQGAAWRCVRAAKAGQVELFHCGPMIAELAAKLRDPFGYPENHVYAVIYEYRRMSQSVTITGQLRAVPNDPDDDMFIECALVAKVPYLVSRDQHLLALGHYQDIAILTPADFLPLLHVG